MHYLKRIRFCSSWRETDKRQPLQGICFWFFSVEKNGQVMQRRKIHYQWEMREREGSEELQSEDKVEGGTDWNIVNSGTGPSSETGRKGVKIQSEMERFLHVGIGR